MSETRWDKMNVRFAEIAIDKGYLTIGRLMRSVQDLACAQGSQRYYGNQRRPLLLPHLLFEREAMRCEQIDSVLREMTELKPD